MNSILPPPIAHVTVIVPVFRGLADTRNCIHAVLASHNTTPFHLLAINDASPEPDITEWLRNMQRHDARLRVIEHPKNLGFVATANHGMALGEGCDVVLLNSDTEVANDWLDRLQRAAYSAPRIASVTPFSNNATICSFPTFLQANPLPVLSTTALDAVFAACNPKQVIDVPTAVGFCMYIRRACLEEVGGFDVKNFGLGYGEENDFCVRATRAGWRHLHALDTYVLHAGGVSFGESKAERQQIAMDTMRRLHPRYEADVHAHIELDPAKAARQRVTQALTEIQAVLDQQQ